MNQLTNQTYGYIRVSSTDQNENRQLITLHKEGIADKHIYIDKQSGKDFNRPQYKKLVKRLRPGDLLCVTSIDRLGRNYEEIQNQWRFLTKKMNIDIRVLDMPLLDTTTTKDLTGTFIADLTLQILSYVAQKEREHIKQRQAEGIAAAKARGVKFGRPKKVHSEDTLQILKDYRQHKLTQKEALQKLHVSASTLNRWLRNTTY